MSSLRPSGGAADYPDSFYINADRIYSPDAGPPAQGELPNWTKSRGPDSCHIIFWAVSLCGPDNFALANENSGLHIFQIVDGEVVQVGVGNALGVERDVAMQDRVSSGNLVFAGDWAYQEGSGWPPIWGKSSVRPDPTA